MVADDSIDASKDVRSFRGSRTKYFGLCAIQGLVGALCFLKGRSFPPIYLIAAFAGVLALVCAWEGLARKTLLTLSVHGFEYMSIHDKTQFTWSETFGFVDHGYAVRFERTGGGPRMIPNLFDARMDEIYEALVAFRKKYGGESAAAVDSSVTR